MRNRASDERGAVLLIVALATTIFLILAGGGVVLFTLYGSHREMQKAADQGALAGAAGMPLLNPGQALSGVPLNTAYELTDDVGLDVPLKGLSNVPDPRAVACAYATRLLESDSSGLTDAFGTGTASSGYCASGPWSDGRVDVSLNSLSTPLSQCLNALTSDLNAVINDLTGGLSTLLSNPLLALLLAPLGLSGGQVTSLVDDTVARLEATIAGVQNLEALSPALLTPEVTVSVTDTVQPPLLSMVTGDSGVEMTVTSVAERRLKNAVVLPDISGLTGVDLNSALAATKPDIETAMGIANTQLNTLFGELGLGQCNNLLSPGGELYQDISDIYDPPFGGPAPSGRDLLDGATDAALRAAGDAGTSVDAVAGEAFLVIRQGPNASTISSLLGPVFSLLGLSGALGNLHVPAVDVALVAAHNLEDGNISNADLIPDAAAARGLFTATLVD